MSLQVWLPLNGDLHNQGLSDITVTNNGATVNNSGKIGKCYQFGTAASDITLPATAMTSLTTECSIAFWIDILTWNTSYATFFQAGTASTAWTAYHFGFLRNNAASTCCFTISNSSSASNANYLTPAFDLNKWYHVVLIYKTGHCLIYINGELYQDYSTSIVPNFAGITTIKLGRCTYGSSYYQTNCLMNDFRIYDHALSAKEVEEIAKGLVLHYQLNFSKQNLISDGYDLSKWGKESGISIEYDTNVNMYKIKDSSHTSSRWGIYKNYTLKANTMYTFSAEGMKVDQNCGLGFREGTSWPANADSYTTSRTRLSKTITVGNADANCRLYLNLSPVADGTNYAYFALPRLEIGNNNIVYDSSGYNNNGQIIGSVNVTELSPILNNCFYMNNTGTSNHIESNNDINISSQDLTASIWFKTTSKNVNQVIFVISNLMEFGTLNSLGYVYPLTSSAGFTLNNFINNTWNHVVVVRSGSNFQLYINGIEETRNGASNSYLHNNSKLYLLNRNYNNNYAGNASIHDFRLYVTALTAKQVQELYNTSMIVDGTNKIPRDLE